MIEFARNIAIFLCTLTVGWTGCIAFAVAPQAFRDLDRGRGDRFVRNLIKSGHGFLALLALLAAAFGLMGGAVAGAVIMALVAFFYLMARYALAPRTDPRPAGARRVMKTARVAASAITAFIIPVALAAMVMISLGI